MVHLYTDILAGARSRDIHANSANSHNQTVHTTFIHQLNVESGQAHTEYMWIDQMEASENEGHRMREGGREIK